MKKHKTNPAKSFPFFEELVAILRQQKDAFSHVFTVQMLACALGRGLERFDRRVFKQIPNALGDGGGDHARAGATFLTGAHCKQTLGADIQAGISADQIVAQQIGKQTRFTSLELGCEDSRIVGACDSGSSCAYQNSIACRTPTSPLPPESNPREVFERLFGTQDLGLAPEVRLRRARARKSILDMVRDDTQSLVTGLGAADRRKIDEYLFAVREPERRIETAEVDNKKFTPTIEKPSGVPVTYHEYANLMFDLQVLAMGADLTRVVLSADETIDLNGDAEPVAKHSKNATSLRIESS